MSKKTIQLGAAPLLAILLFFVARCSGRDARPDTLELARAHGLRVGFSVEPPYALVDSGGLASGESPEILRRLAGEMGITELQWFPLLFHELIPALQAGRIDVIASGMFVTAERRGLVRFSRPTACVEPVEVVPRGSVRAVPGGTCEGCRRAVIQGSVEQRALEKVGTGHVVIVPDLSTAVAAVASGEADGLVISAPTGRYLVRNHPALLLADGALERSLATAAGCAAFAFRLEDSALARAIDGALAGFVGTPAHLRLVKPFGFTEGEVGCAAALDTALPVGAVSCSPHPATARERG